jgi:serine/threonine protein kinase
MTHDDMVQMAVDMLKSFMSLQERNMSHTDVKPANIVKCTRRYKLIDWEMMRDITKRDFGIFKRASASMMFSSPWSNYISGLPKFYSSRFITDGVRRRMPEYYDSREFNDFREHMETEFQIILAWGKDANYLYDMYANTIDIFSLAASINYLCWKNGINVAPFWEWIKICSGAHPPKNAREAYKLWRKLI